MNRDFTPSRKPLSRQRYLQIVHAALTVDNYRFARGAVIKWLANYPGDLQAGLYYARALLGLNRPQQALPILDGLCLADAEFVDAADALLQADMAAGTQEGGGQDTSLLPGGRARTYPSRAARRTYIYALTGRCEDETTECDSLPVGSRPLQPPKGRSQGPQDECTQGDPDPHQPGRRHVVAHQQRDGTPREGDHGKPDGGRERGLPRHRVSLFG